VSVKVKGLVSLQKLQSAASMLEKEPVSLPESMKAIMPLSPYDVHLSCRETLSEE
jgi:hypothetical protein